MGEVTQGKVYVYHGAYLVDANGDGVFNTQCGDAATNCDYYEKNGKKIDYLPQDELKKLGFANFKFFGKVATLKQKILWIHIQKLLESKEKEEAWKRADAAVHLGKIGNKSAVPYLTAKLNDPKEDVHVRAAVVFALRDIGDKSAAPHLVSALKNPKEDTMIRDRAADTLGKMCNADDKIDGKPISSVLINIFKNKKESSEVRYATALALVEMGVNMLKYLGEALNDKDDDFRFRVNVVSVLDDLNAAKVLESFEGEINEDDPIYWYVSQALDNIERRN